MRRLILVFTILALTQCVSAWGPTANKAFCRGAVAATWGQGVLRCLDDKTAYCLESKDVVGGNFSQMCLDAYALGVEVDPATAPSAIFNDVDNFYNYDTCPLKWSRANNEWVCSGKGNPAGDTARLWFNAAENSQNLCTKVREFCSGAFYLASSYYPLHQVTYLQGCVSGSPDTMIDEQLLSVATNWSVKSQCTFRYLKQMAGVSRIQQQHVTFIITEADYDDVMSAVTAEAGYVRNPSDRLPVESTMTSTTESTTSTTTTTESTTTSLVVSTSSTASTTSSTTMSTVASATSPTISSTSTTTSTIKTKPTTTTSTPQQQIVKPGINQSIDEIDSMLGDMITTINKTKKEEPKMQDNLVILAVLVVVMMVSLILLVYLYSMMRRPQIHNRRVILPPSVRRKMRKGT